MSNKRQATTELNHDNWDEDDPSEHEEMGSFKTAPKDVLEKRVIRTAKRRTQASSDEPKKSVFSGFGGFNKAQPSSFNFLANLTNGSKSTNGTPTSSDTPASSSLFSTKTTISSPSGGLFSTSSSATTTKCSTTTTFGSSIQSSTFNTSKPTFTASKSESTNETPFKISPVTAHNEPAKPTSATTASSLLPVPTTGASPNKSLFSSTSTPFKIQPVSTPQNSGLSTKPTSNSETEKKAEDSSDEKKIKYYAKLKGLNESVSEWIKKHVEQTPLCILSPIFKDYEKYLQDIQEEYQGGDKDNKDSTKTEGKTTTNSPKPTAASTFGNTSSSLFSSSNTSAKSVFGNSNNTAEKPVTFGINNSTDKPVTFGINPTSTATTTSSGFSFGIKPTPSTTSSPFSLTTTSTTSSPSTPFSFGIGKPFSFSSNIQQNNSDPPKTENQEDNDDEPPKVEFTPVVEENSVFDKRCKIFVKKDGNFADKGVGTLYIKKIEESGKHQLLVRANTNLGNVLLNLILSSGVPTQRMGKNNVMLVCIPTPDAKPPPTPVLIRVKTGEEADELLETLNKYKT